MSKHLRRVSEFLNTFQAAQKVPERTDRWAPGWANGRAGTRVAPRAAAAVEIVRVITVVEEARLHRPAIGIHVRVALLAHAVARSTAVSYAEAAAHN